jgi:signal transduction histidine kinase
VHPAPGLSLRADLNALEHILFNLIDNAAKYAAGSDPPQVEISARAENGSLVIEVADHGPGIAAEDHRRIFRPFHKSAREAADTQPGVGLGLALSRRLAANLGGSLTLANDLSAGARFQLRLPALQARS